MLFLNAAIEINNDECKKTTKRIANVYIYVINLQFPAKNGDCIVYDTIPEVVVTRAEFRENLDTTSMVEQLTSFVNFNAWKAEKRSVLSE